MRKHDLDIKESKIQKITKRITNWGISAISTTSTCKVDGYKERKKIRNVINNDIYEMEL